MKIVTAAIIRKNNSVLITRRAPGEKLEGFWEFPGGKLEGDETVQECLHRELKEELNIITYCTNIFAESIYKYDGGVIKLVAIDVAIIEGEITLLVHDQYEWVELDKLLDYSLAPADIPIARKIVNA